MWLHAIAQYEEEGGYIPEVIKSAIIACYASGKSEVIIYGAPFDVTHDDIQLVIAWIELNGPDLPAAPRDFTPGTPDTPTFGL